MINVNCNGKIKEIFEKYLKETGLDNNRDFYYKIREIENDIKFYSELLERFPSKSNYKFTPKLHEPGLIYNGFLNKINSYYLSYNSIESLTHCLYIYEILKILFSKYMEANTYENEYKDQIKEFHQVVQYYLDIETVDEYLSDFIGCGRGISAF